MKRLYTLPKYKRLMRTRQKRALQNAQRSRSGENDREPRSGITVRIEAPPQFSLIHNPGPAVSFITRFRTPSKGHHLFVDLSSTHVVTCDAIAVLAAVIESGICPAGIAGNWPADDSAKQLMFNAGFHKRVRVTEPIQAQNRGKIINRKVFLEKIDTEVSTEPARELVEFAKQQLGREVEDKPAYGTLIDLADNTYNHASANMKGQVSWWATVYCDIERHKACYSFVDIGIGIFKSRKFLERVRHLNTRLFTHRDVQMRLLLERKLPSRTGLPYRGRGLPWIYESGKAGRLDSLVIVANDIFAKPLEGEYRFLPQPFRGTFLYWET
jgi:hypothetical protein